MTISLFHTASIVVSCSGMLCFLILPAVHLISSIFLKFVSGLCTVTPCFITAAPGTGCLVCINPA